MKFSVMTLGADATAGITEVPTYGRTRREASANPRPDPIPPTNTFDEPTAGFQLIPLEL